MCAHSTCVPVCLSLRVSPDHLCLTLSLDAVLGNRDVPELHKWNFRAGPGALECSIH